MTDWFKKSSPSKWLEFSKTLKSLKAPYSCIEEVLPLSSMEGPQSPPPLAEMMIAPKHNTWFFPQSTPTQSLSTQNSPREVWLLLWTQDTDVILVAEEPTGEHESQMKGFVVTTDVLAEEILSLIQGFPFNEQLTLYAPGGGSKCPDQFLFAIAIFF